MKFGAQICRFLDVQDSVLSMSSHTSYEGSVATASLDKVVGHSSKRCQD